MRGSKPDSNGSQKLLSKEVGSAIGSIIMFCPLVSYIVQQFGIRCSVFRMKTLNGLRRTFLQLWLMCESTSLQRQ